MADNSTKIFRDIEQTAGFYGGVTYTSLLSQYHDHSVSYDLSEFIPLTAVNTFREKERIMFAVGVIPPSANITGRTLDRSASIVTLSDQEEAAAKAAASQPATVSSTGDEVAGTTSGPDPTPTSGKNNLLHQWARQIMLEAFQEVMGRDPTLAELQYVQAVAFGETGYGKWAGKPEMANSNNWGAVHCSQKQQKNSIVQGALNFTGGLVGATPDCIPSSDKTSAGTGFSVSFKAYATPKDGAKDVVKNVFKGRPKTADALASGQDIFGASYAMRRETYYGGYCLNAVKQYGAGAGTTSGLRNPDQNEGTQACAQEAITGHANDIKRFINDIAYANKDASAMGLGTYAAADAWWRTGSSGTGGEVTGDATAGNWPKDGSGAAQDAASEAAKNAGTPLNSTEVGKKFQAAQRAQIQATQAALEAMAATPPLKLLVNPKSFGVKGDKIVQDGNWGRNGPIIEHWGDGQDKISASGKIAGFYAIDTANAGGPGLSRNARSFSESYANFQALYYLYRNNGGVYLSDPLTEGKTKNLTQVGSVYIYYDSTLYIGSFASFNITENDTGPFTLEYSFEFNVRASFLLDRDDDPNDYGSPGFLSRSSANTSTGDLFSTPQ